MIFEFTLLENCETNHLHSNFQISNLEIEVIITFAYLISILLYFLFYTYFLFD